MSNKTSIEWTDITWNPVTGCTKVSPGCKNCYAERLWPKVSAAEAKRTGKPKRAFTNVRCHPERLDQPLRMRNPQRIFVNSMSDLFHEDVPFPFIADVFAVMSCTTRHTYQVLTKRPQRMLEFFNWLSADLVGGWPMRIDATRVWPQWTAATERRGGYDNCGPLWPLENVWLGVSVENGATAYERIPLLLQTPAAVRFISAEPLLGAIGIDPYLHAGWSEIKGRRGVLNWVIAGGESGPKARPSHPDWFRSLRNTCAAYGVPFFFKQWGEFIGGTFHDAFLPPREPDHCWGDDGDYASFRVGKKAAGRTLDGRTHDDFPDQS